MQLLPVFWLKGDVLLTSSGAPATEQQKVCITSLTLACSLFVLHFCVVYSDVSINVRRRIYEGIFNEMEP